MENTTTIEDAEPILQAKGKKPKPVIRVRKRRGKKSEIIFTKKMISEDDRKFRIHFPVENDDVYKPLLMEIPTCKYEGQIPYNPQENIPADKVTFLSVYTIDSSEENLQKVAKFGKSHRFDFDSDIAVRAFAATVEGKTLERMSYAKSTSVDLGLPKLNGIPYPFQLAGASYAMRTKKTFIADEMGLGKTVEGILVIASTIKSKPGPWLIITPKSLRRTWLKHATKWLKYIKIDRKPVNIAVLNNSHFQVNRKGKLSKENRDFLAKQHIMICNYDMLARRLSYMHDIDWYGFIFDESHYVKQNAALRTKAAKALVSESDAEYVLLLSGTPLVNNPKDLISQLSILGRLGDFGGFNHFIRRYCCISTGDIAQVSEVQHNAKHRLDDESYADTTQMIQDALVRRLYQNMTDLNKALRASCYVRREKSEVLEFLPAKTRSTVLVDITNRKTYQRIEDDVCEYLGDLAVKDKKFLKSIKKLAVARQLEKIKERRASATYRASRAEALVKLQNLKLCAAVGKLKAAKEWIHDYLESGQKLVVFSHHKIIQREIQDEFPDAINTSGSNRETAEERFQTDKKIKVFNGSIERDGVGLTLHAASATCTLELRWNPAKHDQAEDRVHRIGQKDACTAYYLLAAGTVEERIARIIERKRQVVNAVADGDPLKGVEQGSILSVAEELIEELQNRPRKTRKTKTRKAKEEDEDE